MKEKSQNGDGKAIEQLVLAFDDLPILARLEFVSNMNTTKAGEKNDPSRDKALAVADGV